MDDLGGMLNELLKDPQSMEKIKGLASMLAGSGMLSGENHEEDEKANDEKSEIKKNETDTGLPFDPSLIAKIGGAMKLMNTADPRIDFLVSLKSILSDKRRQRVDSAIHLMRLVKLMPLIKEQGFF